MRKIFLAHLVLLTCVTSGCASLTKAKIEKAEVERARNVAIVGFHMLMQEPKSFMGDLKKLQNIAKTDWKNSIPEHEMPGEVYGELAKRLIKAMNWNMKSASQVSQNAQYKELVAKYTQGLQVRPYTPENYRRIRPLGILDADPFIYNITQEQREALMSSLGVDAVIVDFLNANLNNESTFGGLVGAAKYRPKTQNIIRMYVKGKKDPVWFDTWAWGEGDKALQASFNYVEDKPLLEQVVLASRKSIAETLKRYSSN